MRSSNEREEFNVAKLAKAVSKSDHVQGAADAAITLVEYGDYECPSCGEAYPVIKKLQKHFGNKLRFVFRNFPLEQHPMAEPAAETAEFANANSKYWEMHDELFEHQAELGPGLFKRLAKKLGLNTDDLENALDGGSYRAKIDGDMVSGEESGLRGTPAFYINGKMHDGAFDFDTLSKTLTAALGAAAA